MLQFRKVQLSNKKVRKLIESLPISIRDLLSKKPKIEFIELQNGHKIFIYSSEYIAVQVGDKLVPPLTLLHSNKIELPIVTVDMGAVPYVTNGATVMAPGIVSIDPNTEIGDLVVIVEEKYGKPLAIGFLINERDQILNEKKGKAVNNVHYVSDQIWKIIHKS
ncbi:MAG: PUA domain-containing protein [Candidatus Ranarchaeia archaeon]